MNDPRAPAVFRRVTPAGAGAIAVVQIVGDVDAALRAIGVAPVAQGRASLRDLCGVDTGLVARWGPHDAQLMPHGGELVVRRLCERLAELGLAPAPEDDPVAEYPEADDEVEALMLAALARAHSPGAIDLLLRQPARWRVWDGATPPPADVAHWSSFLNRLIEPPVVAAVGAVNIGKSALLNALAGGAVSVVADEPGATRDHVGATLSLGGLVVRWVDTPGLRAEGEPTGPVEAAAGRLAARVVASADAVVVCLDGGSPAPPPARLSAIGVRPDRVVVCAGLRADLGPAGGADIQTSALTGEGLGALAVAVREALVPPDALRWPGPWAFDDRLPGWGPLAPAPPAGGIAAGAGPS